MKKKKSNINIRKKNKINKANNKKQNTKAKSNKKDLNSKQITETKNKVDIENVKKEKNNKKGESSKQITETKNKKGKNKEKEQLKTNKKDVSKNIKKNTNNKLTAILSVFMFLIGTAIFLYPTVSNFIANKKFAHVISTYEDETKKLPKENLESEYQKAVEYNNSLNGSDVHDPFVPGTGYVHPDNYEEVLNITGKGVMGYIEIPKIRVNLPINHGTDEKALRKGVGHIETTAFPIGGENNNPILTGHRGLPEALLFTRLDELKKGDKIYIHILNDVIAYKVDNIMTILPEEVSKLLPIKGKDMITLITCTPYGINTHRLVVQGVRIPYVAKDRENEINDKGIALNESLFIRIVGIILGIIILVIVMRIIRKKNENEKKKN